MSAILLQESSETKDQPLREDIRLLGRILGDTVRSQEGEAVFDIVERIRQTSIRFHREEDQGARKELEAILNSLSPPQTARGMTPRTRTARSTSTAPRSPDPALVSGAHGAP